MSDEYIVFHINGSPDKDLVGTSVINSLKEANPSKKIVVVTHSPEVWIHNPDVYRVYKHGATPYFYKDFIEDKKTRVLALDPYLTSDYIYKKKHLAEIWCDLIETKYNNSLPKIYLTQREEEVAWHLSKTDEKLAIIQPFETYGYPNLVTTWTKDLPFDVVQKVVNAMRSAGYLIIQIKNENQPTFVGAQPIALNLRLTMATIKYTEKRLFVDSFAMQTATAFRLPSVVTWTTSLPKLKGYKMHENIFAKIDTKMKEKMDEYSPVFDVTGQLAAQNIDMSNAFSSDEIIKKLKI